MTKESAIALYDSKWWEGLSHVDIATFQLLEPKLCMPFDKFHECLEKTLGRPVFTHELGLNYDGLCKELLGEKAPPTIEEIINLIPESKRIVIKIDDAKDN